MHLNNIIVFQHSILGLIYYLKKILKAYIFRKLNYNKIICDKYSNISLSLKYFLFFDE